MKTCLLSMRWDKSSANLEEQDRWTWGGRDVKWPIYSLAVYEMELMVSEVGYSAFSMWEISLFYPYEDGLMVCLCVCVPVHFYVLLSTLCVSRCHSCVSIFVSKRICAH